MVTPQNPLKQASETAPFEQRLKAARRMARHPRIRVTDIEWRLGTFRPVSIAWGNPMSFAGLPRGGKGYKEASVEIEREIRKLWEWLAGVHELGRPRDATPPS